MNLVQVSRDTIIDKDKIQALVSEQHNGRFYTRIYLEGDRECFVEKYWKDVEKLINESEDK